jgi:hypothetical protein
LDNISQHTILTLQIIVETLLEELIESEIINKDSFDERISKKVTLLNHLQEELDKLDEQVSNSKTLFMSKGGEA